MVGLFIIPGVVLLIIIGSTFIIYNRLVRKRNLVEQAESDIDVQLKRRRNLIPNLIESVKGYMAHEKETLNAVVSARNQAISAQAGSSDERKAENILEGALKNLFALAESYPDLKASENFINLQNELTDTEDKIQAARRLYNGTLREYIDTLQVVPSNIVAAMFGFKKNGEYFDIDPEEAKVVEVKF